MIRCLGHEGKCQFCKGEEGYQRYVNNMPQIDRLTQEPIVDPCCNACNENWRQRKKTEYIKTSLR